MGVPALGSALSHVACAEGPVTESGVGGRGRREGGRTEASAASVVVEQPRSSPKGMVSLFAASSAFFTPSNHVLLGAEW